MEEKSNNGRKTGGIILVIILVLAALAGAWYWGMYLPEQEAKERARQEQLAKEAEKKRQQQLAAKKKADYDQLIQNADDEFNQENWEAAHSLYSEASSLFRNQPYPLDQLTIINEKLEEIAAQSKVGTVETVSSATGRFYIVVSSSIDGDLAMDYGNKMANEGNSVKIIEPYGQQRFYRVSPGDYDGLDQAVAASASVSTTDGEPAWVLKY